MSVAFASARPRGKGEVTQQTIQKVKTACFVPMGWTWFRPCSRSRGRRQIAGEQGNSCIARAAEMDSWREVGEGGGGGGGTKQRCADRCRESQRRGTEWNPLARWLLLEGKRLTIMQWKNAIGFANICLISDGISAKKWNKMLHWRGFRVWMRNLRSQREQRSVVVFVCCSCYLWCVYWCVMTKVLKMFSAIELSTRYRRAPGWEVIVSHPRGLAAGSAVRAPADPPSLPQKVTV